MDVGSVQRAWARAPVYQPRHSTAERGCAPARTHVRMLYLCSPSLPEGWAWYVPLPSTPPPAVPPVPSDRLDETAGASLHACVHTSGAGFQGGDSTRDGAVPSDGTLRLTELHAGATKNALSAEEQPLIYCVGAGVGVGVGVGMGVGMCVRCRLS